MDFKSEIESFAHRTESQNDEALQEIHRMNETILALLDKNQVLQQEIDQLNAKHAPLTQELNEKNTLLDQWKQALEQHKIKLKTNETLYRMQADIKKNMRDIQIQLTVLGKEKEQIQENISSFYTTHYLDSRLESNLQVQLTEQQAQLDSVISKIEHLETVEQKIKGIARLFLNLFRSLGWVTNPLADEQKKLVKLSDEVAVITKSLEEYRANRAELDALREKEEKNTSEQESLLSQQEAVKHIEEIQKSILESKKTIQALTEKIKVATKECTALQKKINNKALEAKKTVQERLLQDIVGKKTLLREKNLALAQASSPIRSELKTQFVSTLLAILSHQEHAAQKKQELAKKSKFFQPTPDEIGINSVPHYGALVKIQDAIRKFQKGLESGSQETQILNQITSKILIWQMSETNAQSLTFSTRQQGHQALVRELAELIGKLPFDNPLRGAQHYIEFLTTPIEIEMSPTLTSRTGKGKR